MTKTHAENTPSDALTAWRKAFFTKDAKAFAASAPTLIATWALGGLYLSLGPSLALSLLKSDS